MRKTEQGEEVFTQSQHGYLISYITENRRYTSGSGLHAPLLTGLGRLTCFVGYCVGFGHRLLITKVDRGAPLKARSKWEKSECCPV